MSLRDFIFTLVKAYKTILFFLCFFVSLSLLAFFLMPKKWEVYSVMTPPVNFAPVVDSPSNLATRLRSPATLKAVLDGLDSEEKLKLGYSGLRAALRINVIEKSVEVRVETYSPEIGVKISNLLLQQANRQEEMFLTGLVKSNQSVKEEYRKEMKSILSEPISSQRSVLSQGGMMDNSIHVNESSRTVFLVEPGFDPKASSPKLVLLLGMALVLGLICSVVKVFFYDRKSLNQSI